MGPDATPRPRRPRAVADAPFEPLVANADGLAKGWLLALLDAGPIETAAALPAAAFAQEAPVLCAAVARALASERALDRLRGEGDLAGLAKRAGALAGAGDTASVLTALAALRAVIWSATTAELRAGDEDLVAPLAERLAHVTDVLAAAAIAGASAHDLLTPSDLASARRPVAAPLAHEHPLAAAERALEDARRTREALALLLLEVDGADRLPATEGAEASGDLLARAANAVRAVLDDGDTALEEGPGRLWLILPGRVRLAAAEQGELAALAVERAAAVRGAPLTASVGVATYPADGDDVASLAGFAEQSLYAARAAGVRVTGVEAETRPGPRLVR